MSSLLDNYERRKRIKERRRREKEAELLKQQEEPEEKQKKKDKYRPYAWREKLKRKDPPKQSPPSSPRQSTSTKYAKTQSPVQKLLRKSSISKLEPSPSTKIDSKWIDRCDKKNSHYETTSRHSNVARSTKESPQNTVTRKASVGRPKTPPASVDSDSDSSVDSLLAHVRGDNEKKKALDTKKTSPESTEGDRPAEKPIQRKSRRSTDDSEDEGGMRCHPCHKPSRDKSNRKSSFGDSDSISEDDSERPMPSRKKSRLWSNQKSQGSKGIVFSSEDEIEECSERSNRKSGGAKSKKKKSTSSKDSQDIESDFWSDDEKESEVSRGRGKRGEKNKRTEGGNEKHKNPLDSSSDEEAVVSRNSSDDEEAKKETKPVLNPITLAQRQQQSFESIAANCARQGRKTDDDLWSDMDDDSDHEKEDESKAKKGKKRSRSKSETSTRDSRERKESIEVSSPSPSKKGGLSYWYVPNTHDRDDLVRLLKREDEEALQDIIHPEIENPVWSFDYEELDLEGTESAVSVPAALNRYLAPYQKKGIRFMHKCLAAKSGTIMGDEMGLGKTVQVIGLLCALFQKTGTGLDLLRIHRRNKLISEQREMALREEQRALLEGRIYKPQKIDAKSLDLPAWYPVLIIAPPSVVENWQMELERFSHFAVAVFSGTKQTRNTAMERIRDGRAEVMIAAKSLFQDKCGAKDLNEIPWKLVIIDEFHTFKNVAGKLSQHLRTLKADHRPLILGMTGTLMQNDHKELWNLIDLVETDFLGSWKQFEQETARAIKLGRQKGANEDTIARSKRKAKALEEHLAKLFIARTKEDVVADKLTKKTVNVVFCPPSELQKRIYAHILTLPDVQYVKMATSPCDCGVNQHLFARFYRLRTQAERVQYIREKQKEIQKRCDCCYHVPINPRRHEVGQPPIDPDAVLWRMLDGHDENDDAGCPRCPYCVLFSVLDKLNKLSSHIGLLQADTLKGTVTRGSDGYVRFKKEEEFAKVAFPPDIVGAIPGGIYRADATFNEHFELSGKMRVLHDQLDRFKKEGSKVLIFSYSTRTLDFIEQYVRRENHSFLRIDGQVQAKLRQNLCNRFNKERDVFLFLLSTKACGLGLNLTAANKVIIFDVEWNPSWDEQAQDRAYRLGQQNDVEVIRLVTEGTVDELRYLRQLYKVQLKNETLNSSDAKGSARYFRGIQGDKYRKGELFGIENLLKFKEDGSFLADLWKRKVPNGERSTSNEEDITSSLNAKLCDKLFDEDSANASAAYMETRRDSGEYHSGDEDETKHPSRRNQQDYQSEDDDKKMPALPRNGQEQARDQDSSERSRTDSRDRASFGSVKEEDPLDSDSGDSANVAQVHGNDDSEMDISNEDAPAPNANAVNQDALYDEDQGGARYEEGDEGYYEEMGGGTQNAYVSYANMRFPENPQDATFLEDEEEDEGRNQNPQQNDIGNDGVAAAQGAARQRGAALPPPQQPVHHIPAEVAQMRESPMADVVHRRQVPARANSQSSQRGRGEEQPMRQNSESRISIQLRLEPSDASKEDFFRSRDARGRIDGNSDELEGGGGVPMKPETQNDGSDKNSIGGRVAKKPKTDTEDSDESSTTPAKKKVPINLFGKTTTASKSNNSKGNFGGLYIPTYKKSSKKKKK